MRRTAALLLALVLAAGCGGGSADVDPVSVLRDGASKTAEAKSSKLALTIRTKSQGQDITISGDGAYDYVTKEGLFTLSLGGVPGAGSLKLEERIVGDTLYIQVPQQPGFYRLALKDLVGTSLADSANPTSALQQLAGVSDDVTEVGTAKVRGTETTHYKGTIDVQKALDALDGALREHASKAFETNGVTTIPFDAYVDDDGRVRKVVQQLTLTVQGEKAEVSSTLELFDFGTAVDVEAPPADQVQDGSQILQYFKAGTG